MVAARHFQEPSSCDRSAARKDSTLSNYLLRLYVTGKTPRAEKAIANLRRICEDDLQGRYELQIIDVLQDPQLAEDEKILATPTLIKRLPPPLRRVIGDLSDREKVLLGLEVWPDLPPADDDPDHDPAGDHDAAGDQDHEDDPDDGADRSSL
jgi:circadian clock protein KaiB